MKNLVFAGVIENISTRKDRTMKIQVGTSLEMPAESKTALFELNDKEAWILISANDDITEADVPLDKPKSGMGVKTPAERLRAVLYVLYKERGAEGDFDDFYRLMVEKFIDWTKEKLS